MKTINKAKHELVCKLISAGKTYDEIISEAKVSKGLICLVIKRYNPIRPVERRGRKPKIEAKPDQAIYVFSHRREQDLFIENAF